MCVLGIIDNYLVLIYLLKAASGSIRCLCEPKGTEESLKRKLIMEKSLQYFMACKCILTQT